MFSIKHPALAALMLTSVLTACTGPLDQQKSGIDLPAAWNRLVSGEAASPDAVIATAEKQTIEHGWWKHFNDPVLNALIDSALENNKTLAIAKARVEEARANRVGARSILMPQIDGVANSTRGNEQSFTDNKPFNIHQAGVQASWEFDLFGKNQARAAQSSALLQSEEATLQGVRVGLLADVARTYFELRNIERQIALTENNLKTQNQTVELTEAQMEGALASDFDVQRAGAQLATTAAIVPQLHATRDALKNRLNVLLGSTPGSNDAVMKIEGDMAPLDKKILVSAPASVIAERPDVRAAERQFAASISASSAATRELFPSINLLGFYGAKDAPFGADTPWNLGASLVQPILNFGRISAQIDAADAREKQAFLTYQQTVLEALEDMENALSSYLNEMRRNEQLHKAADQNKRAVELAREQFTNGDSALLDVLVVERNLLEAQSNMAASDAKLRQDLVRIYTAAGGGWKTVAANEVSSPKQEPTKKLAAPEAPKQEPAKVVVPFKKAIP